MTRPRPAFGTAQCAPFGVGCAAARDARRRGASPEGGAAGRRKHIYRKQFTPAGMSRKGNPYDNAAMESFNATYKRECVGLAEERAG